MTRWLGSMAAVGAMACGAFAESPEWPQFRGPAAAGVADGKTPPVKFGPELNVGWKVPTVPGFSSPVVVGGKIVLTGFEGGKLHTVAYDRTTGKELWRATVTPKEIEPYHKTEGSPAASTSVTDGERVVSYFGSAGLYAYDLSGKELWKYELPTAKTQNDFGSGTSPILVDGVVVLVRDLVKESRIIAVDVVTGSKKWEVKREGFPTGWGSPAVWPKADGNEIVVPGGFRLKGYDPKDGAEKWSVGGLSSIGCTTPVVADGQLIYTAWAPGGGAEFKMPGFDDLLKADANKDGVLDLAESENSFLKGFFESNDTNKDGKITRDEWDAQIKFMAQGKNVGVSVRPGGKGDITATHVNWKIGKGLPYVPTPLVYRGLVYTANMRGVVSAFDAKTGKEAYLEENMGLNGVYASPVAADGHVYFFGLDGGVVVLKAGEVPEVAFRGKLGERVAATPAVVEKGLIVRTAKHLYLFQNK